MTHDTLTENLPLTAVVEAFNRVSPAKRTRRTVQRWLERHSIDGAGSSKHNWFYDAVEVHGALAQDFPFARLAKRVNGRHPSPKKARAA